MLVTMLKEIFRYAINKASMVLVQEDVLPWITKKAEEQVGQPGEETEK